MPGPFAVRRGAGLDRPHYGALLRKGAVLVAEDDRAPTPYALVYLEHAIADGRPAPRGGHTMVSRRFQFVGLRPDGETFGLDGAPYLDLRPPTEAERTLRQALLDAEWLIGDQVERAALDYAIAELVPQHASVVRAATLARVEKIEQKVRERLTQQITFWDNRANVLREQEEGGKQPRMNAQAAKRRADDLSGATRRTARGACARKALTPQRPVVAGAALVLPAGMLAGKPRGARPAYARDRTCGAPGGRGSQGGRAGPGTRAPGDGSQQPRLRHRVARVDGTLLFIEVKGRVAGAETVTVTRNEILTGLNRIDDHVLAIVEVGEDNATMRYVRRAFSGHRGSLLRGGQRRLQVARTVAARERAVMTGGHRKLIEVAVPLEAINAACKADKDRKTGTIRNLHKWFAPMPSPAWRALLFATLVDDPGDEPGRQRACAG